MKTAWLSVVLIGLSGAAIAQVAGAPLEPKPGTNTALPALANGSDATSVDNAVAPGNVADPGKSR